MVEQGKPKVYAKGEGKKTRQAHWGDLKATCGFKEGDVILGSPLSEEI